MVVRISNEQKAWLRLEAKRRSDARRLWTISDVVREALDLLRKSRSR